MCITHLYVYATGYESYIVCVHVSLEISQCDLCYIVMLVKKQKERSFQESVFDDNLTPWP